MFPTQSQRPRFYEGQYLGAADLTALVAYIRRLAAQHALGAHAWGIAVGLNLVEKPSPAGNNQVDVFITPGYAWDGFGRPIIVLAPYRIPADLFQEITYDPIIDQAGKGRRIEIWLRYHEEATLNPQPGFEVCDVEDALSRVQETYLVEVGAKLAHIDDHDPLSLSGVTTDAAQALKAFDPNAPVIYDESIPHQLFPEADQNARWLVPIGYVRWQPAQIGPGSFMARDDSQANNRDSDAIRNFRRYIGVVAEQVLAAEGALRLRSRGKDPATSFFKLPSEELVWVEGHLRIEGDNRLAGGALDWRDPAGNDFETPLKIRRSEEGRLPNQAGGRALQIFLGKAPQGDNRLAIGQLKADGGLDEKVSILSNGNIGIGTASPAGPLHVVGSRIRLENDGKRLDLRADGNAVDVQSETHDLYLRSTGHNLLLNPYPADGQVAIGSLTPQVKLHVVGDRIRLENGGKRLDLRADGGAVDLQSETHDLYIRSTGHNLLLNPYPADGRVSVGSLTPQVKLHVVGDRIRLENSGKHLDLRADGSAVDLQSETHDLYVHSIRHNLLLNPLAGDGQVGVGVLGQPPLCKLHVADSKNLSAGNLDAHVMLIENTSSGSNADVLALRVEANNPDSGNNYITFFAGSGAIGSIEQQSGTLVLQSVGADLAECLPRLDEAEHIQPGDLVGVIGGKVTLRTSGAHHISAVTDRPVVLANAPSKEKRHLHEQVAFIGQVPVKVRGRVKAGDFIMPSGLEDGSGIAVPLEGLSEHGLGQVAGRAWESSDDDGLKTVQVAIGLPSSSDWMLALIHSQAEQIQALHAAVSELANHSDA